ncbi:MAG: efflux transporter outer membrane subunit [Pseudomonadota bacterium]
MLIRPAALLLMVGLLPGCVPHRPPALPAAQLPAAYGVTQFAAPVMESDRALWRLPLTEPLIRQAWADNYGLAQQAELVEQARQNVAISGASRLPALSISAGAQRGRQVDTLPILNSFDVAANFTFEVDLWGRLTLAQKRARLQLAAQELSYLGAQRDVAVNVLSTTFDLLAARQQQRLLERRLESLNASLELIERGYRNGLNSALDVYLARNTVEQQQANLASQRQLSFTAGTGLQLLVAEYPDGRALRGVMDALPGLREVSELGVPSQLLTRREDVQAAWFELLAADLDLAVAHRSRFPALSLTASVRDRDDAWRRLLDGGELAWTAGASLLAPLFQGGRLRAREAAAHSRARQAEQRYLAVVFRALSEVENALLSDRELNLRMQSLQRARDNAERARQLANDQYLRGLVTYTTVLESQRRAFDTETSVLQVHNQLLQNRIRLQRAVGGNF